MSSENNVKAFLTFIKAGLWELDVRLMEFGGLDYKRIYRLAEEQAVVGLVAAGVEHVVDVTVPKEDALLFVAAALQAEQRNKRMNAFVSELIAKMRKMGIIAILVKGQGIAQCYERPLWRASGDVDLLLDNENYEKAKDFLIPLATKCSQELKDEKHIEMTIDSWSVEIHGDLPCFISNNADKVLSEIQLDVLAYGNVRKWINDGVNVFLPSPNEDIILVFTHILKHFFYEGVGLRQVCDWCRLVWTYHEEIDRVLLERRLKKMKLLKEWLVFSTVAVNYLGMPKEIMPLYCANKTTDKQAGRVLSIILEKGNFGHNRDISYYSHHSFFIRKTISFWNHTLDGAKLFVVFPKDSTVTWWRKIVWGIKEVNHRSSRLPVKQTN